MTAPDPGGSPRASSRRAAWIVVCLAACLPYLRTIPDYFVQDDFGVVQLLAQKPWSTFPRWFAMPWMEDIWGYTPDEIRPFPALSYQVTALPGASAPEGHHLLNIALHAGNGLLVLALARAAAGLGTAGAAVAAVAFVLLPVGAESVAWITGRVDSMPAFFYLASFLAYVRWRHEEPRGRRLYIWSLVWFFLALFSKQNTITMVAALGAYDLAVARRPIRVSWPWLRPYVPFALMTGAFLGLRYMVLGEVLRESQLSSERLARSGGMLARHLERIVFGDVGAATMPFVLGLAVYALAAVASLARADGRARGAALRAALYFGPVWLALGLAPSLAAGYESPRHAYLAAAGWAILIGIAADTIARAAGPDRTGSRYWRRAAAAATLLILLTYGVRLNEAVSAWGRRADVSRAAVEVLEREVLTAAPGTLVIAGVPVPSWEWSMPFSARPPFAGADLTSRAFIITPELLHCCRGRHWDRSTRDALEGWRRAQGPVVALYVDAGGGIRRLTSGDDPDLEVLARLLPEIAATRSLDGAIVDILRKLVAGRGSPIR